MSDQDLVGAIERLEHKLTALLAVTIHEQLKDDSATHSRSHALAEALSRAGVPDDEVEGLVGISPRSKGGDLVEEQSERQSARRQALGR